MSLDAVPLDTPSRTRNQVVNVRAMPPERQEPSASIRGSKVYRTPSRRPVTRRIRVCASARRVMLGAFHPSRTSGPVRPARSSIAASIRANASSIDSAGGRPPAVLFVDCTTGHHPPPVPLSADPLFADPILSNVRMTR